MSPDPRAVYKSKLYFTRRGRKILLRCVSQLYNDLQAPTSYNFDFVSRNLACRMLSSIGQICYIYIPENLKQTTHNCFRIICRSEQPQDANGYLRHPPCRGRDQQCFEHQEASCSSQTRPMYVNNAAMKKMSDNPLTCNICKALSTPSLPYDEKAYKNGRPIPTLQIRKSTGIRSKESTSCCP